MTGSTLERICAICGAPITGRADRATCSPRCKEARQRARQTPRSRPSDIGDTRGKANGRGRASEVRTPAPAPRYADEKRLEPRVAAAFLRAGVEPPHRDTIDARRYTFAERRIIERSSAA